MAVPVDPYTFADGAGNTASGVQVNQRFSPLYNALNPAVVGLDYQNVQNQGLREVNMGTGANGLAKGAFSAYRSAAVAPGNGVVVVMDAEEFDVSGWFDTATGKFTPQVAGYYRLNWALGLSGAAAADVWLRASVRKNAAVFKFGASSFQRGALAVLNSVGSAVVQANGTTDNFDIWMEQSSGGVLALQTGASACYFQGELIGRS